MGEERKPPGIRQTLESAVGRRRFVTGVLTLTGGGALTAATIDRVGSASGDDVGGPSSTSCYRETEHIRQFYARCRF